MDSEERAMPSRGFAIAGSSSLTRGSIAEKESPVAREFNAIDAVMTEIEMQLSRLIERIGPVLSPDHPRDSEKTPARPEESGLVGALASKQNRLARIAVLTREVADRVTL